MSAINAMAGAGNSGTGFACRAWHGMAWEKSGGRGALFQLSQNLAVDQNQPYHYTANAKRTNLPFDAIHLPPTGATQ